MDLNAKKFPFTLLRKLRNFEKKYLKSVFSRIYVKIIDYILVKSFPNNFNIYYEKKTINYLSSLCDKYGSDKGFQEKPNKQFYGWEPHTYADFYSHLFDHCRFDIKKVFECGIGTNNPKLISTMGSTYIPGSSLRVWRDYFENAQIYGADVDKDIMFSEERIKTFYVDQTDKDSIAKMWNNINETDFDLIIDDGLHRFQPGCCLWENSFGRLKKNAIYIIEDNSYAYILELKDYFNKKNVKIEIITLNSSLEFKSNSNIILIRK